MTTSFPVVFHAHVPEGHVAGLGLPEGYDPDGEDLARLHPEERVFARALSHNRARLWIGGRLALRTALAAAGLTASDALLATPRGAPKLPPNARGSISHKADLAVAIATQFRETHNGGDFCVGVDVEDLRSHEGKPRIDIGGRVLTVAEQSRMATLPGADRWAETRRVFSAKEALYKALDPFVLRYVGFHEAEVAWELNGVIDQHRPTLPTTIQFRLGLIPPRPDLQACGSLWQISTSAATSSHAASISTADAADWVVTTARVDRQAVGF